MIARFPFATAAGHCPLSRFTMLTTSLLIASQLLAGPDIHEGTRAVATSEFTPIAMESTAQDVRSPKFRVLVQDTDGEMVPFEALSTHRDAPGTPSRSVSTGQLTSNGHGGGTVFRGSVQLPSTAAAGNPTKICELAIDTDFELYQRLGSDVQATVDFVENAVRRVDVIFERDVNVSVELTTLVVRTSPSSIYTSDSIIDLLDALRTEWSIGALTTANQDVAHLMTGKNLQFNLNGYGFQDSVCGPTEGYSVGFPFWSSGPDASAFPLAFGIGKNFGAPNCDGQGDCRIMCGISGGCTGDITSFGAASAAVIQMTAATSPCLRDAAPPLTVPVTIPFANGVVDESLWFSNPVAGPSDLAVAPPSPPFAALLTASGPDAGLDDRWITNKVLLGGAIRASLSCFVQHRGVPANRELLVEYTRPNGRWLELGRVVSDGVDQQSFSPIVLPLPGSARHDDVQFRFTVDVDGPTEQWFVDDIEIRRTVESYCEAAANSVSPDGAQLGVVPFSSVSLSANDLSLVASSCPADSFGIYLYADQQVQTPLGDGFLCVNGQQIFRAAVVQADATGVANFTLDQTALPQGSLIQPGDTVNFQLWYRDSIGAGFNLTNGLAVTFSL